VISPATAEAATRYQRTFHGHASQVAQVRRDIAAYLDGCPAADDAILVVSEIATNALVHSRSNGESFTVRSEIFRDYVWIECEDLGGPWQCARPDDRPHGLDVIGALAGPDNWGTETTSSRGRIVWARLHLSRRLVVDGD
jgi:serine/threonine-protein kinase RsbW